MSTSPRRGTLQVAGFTAAATLTSVLMSGAPASASTQQVGINQEKTETTSLVETANRVEVRHHQVPSPLASSSTPYTVQDGDTLSTISQAHLGDSNAWPAIWKANEGTVPNPDEIYPGQNLTIPPPGTPIPVVEQPQVQPVAQVRPAPSYHPADTGGTAAGILGRIEKCESGDRNVVNGYGSTASGYFQILDSTWAGYGGYARAIDAPYSVQLAKAETLGIDAWDASRSCWG